MLDIADLHTHTTCSDGILTPTELVTRAKQAGVTILSVTDHDTVDGVSEAFYAGAMLGITLVAGIEFSASWNNKEIHILGYYINPGDIKLQQYLTLFREQRFRRAEQMVKKLNSLKIPLKFESVLEQAGNGVVCRPHIAEAMVKQKFTSSYNEVFQKYIGDDGPAYEKKPDFPVEKAIEVIADAGGLSFLAHPANFFTGNELYGIIKTGLDGIEVMHPSHSRELQQYYRGITSEYFLLESGGSDFHGGFRNDEKNLGQYGVSPQAIDRMRQRLNRV